MQTGRLWEGISEGFFSVPGCVGRRGVRVVVLLRGAGAAERG